LQLLIGLIIFSAKENNHSNVIDRFKEFTPVVDGHTRHACASGGHRVMLDYDLAELYETETKYLKRAARINIRRFPADFMFELSKTEWETLRCNFSTSNQRGGTRYLPFAFTEQGVAMLSAVLNSEKAI
jgi:hypothetical protein